MLDVAVVGALGEYGEAVFGGLRPDEPAPTEQGQDYAPITAYQKHKAAVESVRRAAESIRRANEAKVAAGRVSVSATEVSNQPQHTIPGILDEALQDLADKGMMWSLEQVVKLALDAAVAPGAGSVIVPVVKASLAGYSAVRTGLDANQATVSVPIPLEPTNTLALHFDTRFGGPNQQKESPFDVRLRIHPGQDAGLHWFEIDVQHAADETRRSPNTPARDEILAALGEPPHLPKATTDLRARYRTRSDDGSEATITNVVVSGPKAKISTLLGTTHVDADALGRLGVHAIRTTWPAGTATDDVETMTYYDPVSRQGGWVRLRRRKRRRGAPLLPNR